METNFNETNNPMIMNQMKMMNNPMMMNQMKMMNNPMMMNQMEMKINPMMMNLMINQMNMMNILNNHMMNNENNGGTGGYQNNNFKDRFGNPKKVYFSFQGKIKEKTINIYKNDDYHSLYNKLHKILVSEGKNYIDQLFQQKLLKEYQKKKLWNI